MKNRFEDGFLFLVLMIIAFFAVVSGVPIASSFPEYEREPE